MNVSVVNFDHTLTFIFILFYRLFETWNVSQVVTQFKSSLVGLTEILMSKEPWYVRCIKPNEAKQPGELKYP